MLGRKAPIETVGVFFASYKMLIIPIKNINCDSFHRNTHKRLVMYYNKTIDWRKVTCFCKCDKFHNNYDHPAESSKHE